MLGIVGAAESNASCAGLVRLPFLLIQVLLETVHQSRSKLYCLF